MTGERVAGIGAFVVVVAGVAIGFATIGPPQHVRLVELDRRRVIDLQSIVTRLRDDEGARRAGPPSKLPLRPGDDWPRDPFTAKPYGYHRESATRYRLCAAFALPSDPDADEPRWRHGAGPTCYRFDLTTSRGAPEQVRTVRYL